MWSSFSGMLTIYGLTALFTGSSVYVYAGFQGITVGLEIDDGQSVTATSPPPTPPPYPPPNVPLSELQDLPSADHTATIDLLRWENGTTSLCLDYALIKKSDFEISRAQSPVAHDVFSSAWGPINFEAFSVEWSFLPSLTPQPTSTSQSGIPRSLQTINSQIVTTSYASTSALPQSFTSQPAITSTPGLTTQPATTPYLFTPGLTTQPTTASSTSLEASSGLVGSAYTSAAASAVSNTGVNLGAVVGGACGLAALIAITTAIIFLKKHKLRHVKLAGRWRLDPFPATTVLPPEQTASLPVQPMTDEKARIRLAAREAVVYQQRRQSDSQLSDFDILATADNICSAPNGQAGPSTDDPFSHDFVIDCRRENTPPRGLSVPPSYRTLEGSIASDSTL